MSNFGNFLKNDCGSATLWNVVWITNFVLLLGLGLDTSIAMNTKAQLQNATDAASHSAAISVLVDEVASVNNAVNYGNENVPFLPDEKPAVQASDITIGFWDEENRQFASTGQPYNNAVRVWAERSDARGNPVIHQFLRAINLEFWEIRAASISRIDLEESSLDNCEGNGVITSGDLDLAANNTFTGAICMHAEQQFKITEGNLITCGVEFSTPSPDNWQTGSSSPQPGRNGDWGDCSGEIDYSNITNDQAIDWVTDFHSRPLLAQGEYDSIRCRMNRIFGQEYTAQERAALGLGVECDHFVSNPDTTFTNSDLVSAIPPYLVRSDTLSVAQFNSNAKKGVTELGAGNTLRAGTLYHVSCGNSGQAIDAGGILQNIGIYTTDCVIQPKRDKNVSALKPTKHVSGQNATEAALCADALDDPNANASQCDTVIWDMEIAHDKFACSRENQLSLNLDNEATGITAADVSSPNHPLNPDLNGLTALPANYSYDPDAEEVVIDGETVVYYEPYQTFLDTAVGEEYRAGLLVAADISDVNGTELCAIEPGSTLLWDNVFIFNSYLKNDNPGLDNVVLPNNSQIGRIDGCREGGGVRLYTASSFKTPSGTTIHGSHFVVIGDVSIAAKQDGVWGITIEAVGDVSIAAQGVFGGCSPSAADLASDFTRTVRPVAIVR